MGDQNGAIDSNELQTVLKTLGQNIGKDEVQEMMSSVDMNDNGEIEFLEFVQMMENRMFLPSNTTEYQDAFKFFDKNGDGYIDFGELKDVLLSLGEDFVDQDIKDMIDEADTTGNGKVGFHEFLKMMPSSMLENYEKCAEKEAQSSFDQSVDLKASKDKVIDIEQNENSNSGSQTTKKPTKKK